MKARMQISKKVIDKIWFPVFHSEYIDKDGHPIPQGYVRLSFELMPLDEAELKQNGKGRDGPNVKNKKI